METQIIFSEPKLQFHLQNCSYEAPVPVQVFLVIEDVTVSHVGHESVFSVLNDSEPSTASHQHNYKQANK